MSLINASEITMVTMDNLITTAIKDMPNKNQRTESIITVTFFNKTRNDLIQLEIIEERIKWFIKIGAVINKPFSHLTEKDITPFGKKISKKV